MPEKRRDERVSMAGHDPESVLRALLAVDPDDVQPEADDDDRASTKKDPAHEGPGE